MGWTNFHTHCNFCDGKGEIEEYVSSAIVQGVNTLGFSSHAPESSVYWTMPDEKFGLYCETVEKLKAENKDKIQIYLGLELEYGFGMPEQIQTYKHGLDYTIGSVHFFGKSASGENLPVDDDEEDFIKSIEYGFNGNVEKAIKHYYSLVQDMVSQGGFDIVGHLDLVKKNNPNGKYFSEDELWYKDIVVDTLNKIAKSGLILEVNNGGITRKKINSLYPSNWILEKCRELNIPITISSDAHSPENVAAGFEETAKTLLDIGFTEIFVLGEKGWKSRKLTLNGIE